jgi:hypothetical protein
MGTSRSTTRQRISKPKSLTSSWTSMSPAAANRLEGVGSPPFRGSDAVYLHERAADIEANEILSVVPDARKAQAVKSCREGEVTPGAGIHSAQVTEHDCFSGQTFLRSVEPAKQTGTGIGTIIAFLLICARNGGRTFF